MSRLRWQEAIPNDDKLKGVIVAWGKNRDQQEFYGTIVEAGPISKNQVTIVVKNIFYRQNPHDAWLPFDGHSGEMTFNIFGGVCINRDTIKFGDGPHAVIFLNPQDLATL